MRPTCDSTPRRRHAGHLCAHPGFTLIELLVVVIILAIWAGIAVPRVAHSVTHHRAEAAATRVTRDLALAQARAKATSAGQEIVFDVAANRYAITGMRDIDRSDKDYTVRLAEPPYEAAILSAVFDDDATLVFDGYGVPDSGGTVLIAVGRQRRLISVEPGTANVAVIATLGNPVGG